MHVTASVPSTGDRFVVTAEACDVSTAFTVTDCGTFLHNPHLYGADFYQNIGALLLHLNILAPVTSIWGGTMNWSLPKIDRAAHLRVAVIGISVMLMIAVIRIYL